MTPTGIEPELPPWKGDVLTAWPWSHNSPSRARTYNNSVNSRVLYHWAIEEYILIYSESIWFIPSKPNIEIWILQDYTTKFWFCQPAIRISPRPISKYQLNTLLCLHLIPIYLVVFKGSYLLGYLILRGASRLDAFSVYPFRTWLLCHRFDI